jgi:hypothetical protein
MNQKVLFLLLCTSTLLNLQILRCLHNHKNPHVYVQANVVVTFLFSLWVTKSIAHKGIEKAVMYEYFMSALLFGIMISKSSHVTTLLSITLWAAKVISYHKMENETL